MLGYQEHRKRPLSAPAGSQQQSAYQLPRSSVWPLPYHRMSGTPSHCILLLTNLNLHSPGPCWYMIYHPKGNWCIKPPPTMVLSECTGSLHPMLTHFQRRRCKFCEFPPICAMCCRSHRRTQVLSTKRRRTRRRKPTRKETENCTTYTEQSAIAFSATSDAWGGAGMRSMMLGFKNKKMWWQY